jgi:hypothetical protein
VDIDHLAVDDGPVTFLRILLSCITEETAENGLLDTGSVLPTRHHIQFVPGNEKK